MSIKESCNLVGISRSSHYCYIKDYPLKRASTERHLKENEELHEEIETIKSCHPFWGYRRVTALLKHRLKINVNHRKVHGIMKEHNLTVSQGKRREIRLGSGGSKRSSPYLCVKSPSARYIAKRSSLPYVFVQESDFHAR